AHANISVPAAGASGASVSYAAEGTDAEQTGVAIPAVCSPASGSTFPIGATTVSCTVTDFAGLTGTGSFTVSVTINAPTFTPPVAITTPATTGAGATVTFTASGDDVEQGAIGAVCAPASGSTFPIGAT